MASLRWQTTYVLVCATVWLLCSFAVPEQLKSAFVLVLVLLLLLLLPLLLLLLVALFLAVAVVAAAVAAHLIFAFLWAPKIVK